MYAGRSSGNGITNIGDKAVTITDTTVSDASTLVTLNSSTSGAITASSVTAVGNSISSKYITDTGSMHQILY